MHNPALTGSVRIGIDVGGTFTDFVMIDGASGSMARHKEPSVPADPSLAVSRGITAILAAHNLNATAVGLVVHGTTIALNATIQRKGARLGMVVSPGGRGVLEIARAQMPDAFDYLTPREAALVPRDRIIETRARTAHDGTELVAVDGAELDRLATELGRHGVEAVTVMLLHSYAFPAHEQAIRDGLRARLPGVSINASSDVWPEKREYERAMLSLINAYTQPLMESYYDRLSERLKGIDIAAPILITANNGGALSLDTARHRPIDTILSGPAAGVDAAARIARELGTRAVLTFDMGGTSADMSIVRDGRPVDTTVARVGDFPLSMPVVGVTAIGAGGGSLVKVDSHGMIHVGPESAGAAPGPVCFGRGGTIPTVTDCYLLTGMIAPDRFLGGRITLDRAASAAAVEALASGLGYADQVAERTAYAALRISAAGMAADISQALARNGDDPRDFSLLAFGGAGPTHAALVAEEAGINEVIIPALSSTLCAYGAILADVKRDFVASQRLSLRSATGAADLDQILGNLEASARAWIDGEAWTFDGTAVSYRLEMRYRGQGFDLGLDLPASWRDTADAAALVELFHAAHLAAFGYNDPASEVLVSTQRCRMSARLPSLPGGVSMASTAVDVPANSARPVFDGTGFRDAAVIERASLQPGTSLEGPALVEHGDSTTWVPDGWSATCADNYCLVLRRKAD